MVDHLCIVLQIIKTPHLVKDTPGHEVITLAVLLEDYNNAEWCECMLAQTLRHMLAGWKSCLWTNYFVIPLYQYAEMGSG